MCSTVQFTYRCGCVESTTFECPDITTNLTYPRRRRRRRRCYGPCRFISTVLDENCYDCSGVAELSTPIPVGVLRDRSLNVPIPRPPTPIMGMDLGMVLFEL
ncbi:hypothetical protein K449DRAFT_395357 [Hypoxylon sp. EC38]|nr:hypothetical protein K449DRAFT_395357 [Hypoxylon sp. EC38]